jgi:hypothetical protein
MKSEPGCRGVYNWATAAIGGINIGTWSSRLGDGHKAEKAVLQQQQNFLQNPKRRKSDALSKSSIIF